MNFGFSVNSCSSKRRRMASRYAAHSAGFADGLAWLFGRFKTADKVFGDFTHATQRNVRRIFFLIGGEKAGVEANQRGLGQWLVATKRGIGNQSAAQHQRMRVRKMPRQFKAVRFGNTDRDRSHKGMPSVP